MSLVAAFSAAVWIVNVVLCVVVVIGWHRKRQARQKALAAAPVPIDVRAIERVVFTPIEGWTEEGEERAVANSCGTCGKERGTTHASWCTDRTTQLLGVEFPEGVSGVERPDGGFDWSCCAGDVHGAHAWSCRYTDFSVVPLEQLYLEVSRLREEWGSRPHSVEWRRAADKRLDALDHQIRVKELARRGGYRHDNLAIDPDPCYACGYSPLHSAVHTPTCPNGREKRLDGLYYRLHAIESGLRCKPLAETTARMMAEHEGLVAEIERLNHPVQIHVDGGESFHVVPPPPAPNPVAESYGAVIWRKKAF